MNLIDQQHRYAEVLVKIGVELKNGQSLFVEAPVEAAEFVPILLEEAYKAGAGDTYVFWTSEKAERMQAAYRSPEGIESEMEMIRQFAERGYGYIRLLCPDFREDKKLTPERINELAVVSMERRRLFRTSPKPGGFTLGCIPGRSWADRVYPELDEETRLEALWNALLTCMRCNEEDPVGAWKQYISDTRARKAKLDRSSYQAYHFKSAKTDLTIIPAQEARWFGGCIEFPEERVFIPNLPTEEVFSVPHRFKVEGYVSSTLPLVYNGNTIENFVLRFHEGRIVSVEAEKGRELLEAIIETDEGSHYLGEFALVDQASPIARMKKTFYTTLFDENASCHLAIGMIAGQMPLERSEELGLNRSRVHVDFMFGSNDLLVRGQRPDGTWEEIMVDGKWSEKF